MRNPAKLIPLSMDSVLSGFSSDVGAAATLVAAFVSLFTGKACMAQFNAR